LLNEGLLAVLPGTGTGVAELPRSIAAERSRTVAPKWRSGWWTKRLGLSPRRDFSWGATGGVRDPGDAITIRSLRGGQEMSRHPYARPLKSSAAQPARPPQSGACPASTGCGTKRGGITTIKVLMNIYPLLPKTKVR
jgi:hypothetical protein